MAGDLSIVIVTWNVRPLALACLASLHAAVCPEQVIVVDNASNDGTVEAVRAAYPAVHVIANSANAGFARACNQGICQATGEFVLLLNPDCLVLGAACTLLVVHLRDHPAAGAAGPRLLRPDGNLAPHNPRRPPTLWRDLCERSGLSERRPHSPLFCGTLAPGWQHRSSGAVEGLSGACLLLRRQALAQAGLLDEGFFLFGEDADLCVRLRRAGWQLDYVAEAALTHVGGASTRQDRRRAALHALAARQRYFCKHRGSVYALAHRVLNAGLAASKIVVLGAPALIARSSRERLRTQWQLLRWCVRNRQT